MPAQKHERLIEKVKNRPIIAYDLFGKKHKRWLKKFKFRVGAFGVLTKGTKILVQRHPKLKNFGFPGGGVKMDESIPHGLEREYFEETGIKVKTGKLLGIVEDYFTYDEEDIHGINIFYKVKKISGKLLTDGNGRDTVEVKFIDINELTKKNSSRAQWPFLNKYKKMNN